MQGNRVTGVDFVDKDGGRGHASAATVVNAAGTRAAEVLRWSGLELAVEPRKRTVFVIDAPNARHPDAPLLIDRGFYLRPEHGHWITATVPDSDGPCDPTDFEPDLHHLFEEVIWEQLYARAPASTRSRWCGTGWAITPITCWTRTRSLARIRQCRTFSYATDSPATDCSRRPAVGRGLAEHILTGRWQSLDLSDLSVARMIDGKPFREQAIV